MAVSLDGVGAWLLVVFAGLWGARRLVKYFGKGRACSSVCRGGCETAGPKLVPIHVPSRWRR